MIAPIPTSAYVAPCRGPAYHSRGHGKGWVSTSQSCFLCVPLCGHLVTGHCKNNSVSYCFASRFWMTTPPVLNFSCVTWKRRISLCGDLVTGHCKKKTYSFLQLYFNVVNDYTPRIKFQLHHLKAWNFLQYRPLKCKDGAKLRFLGVILISVLKHSSFSQAQLTHCKKKITQSSTQNYWNSVLITWTSQCQSSKTVSFHYVIGYTSCTCVWYVNRYFVTNFHCGRENVPCARCCATPISSRNRFKPYKLDRIATPCMLMCAIRQNSVSLRFW